MYFCVQGAGVSVLIFSFYLFMCFRLFLQHLHVLGVF